MKIAYITTYKPRECGIATFANAQINRLPDNERNIHEQFVVALNDRGGEYEYPDEVRFVIREEVLDDYHRAADFLNKHADLVVLQHEFNIFGGDNGVYILPLMKKLSVPAMAVFHTVYKTPSVPQKLVLQEISNLVEKVVVISQTAAEFCRSIYNIPLNKLEVIAHGIPDITYDTEESREKLNLKGKKVMMTFGLVTRNKGIETILRALPAVVKKHPDVVYLCLGKTHPTVTRMSGEEYRESLEEMTQKLAIDDHVIFRNEFLSDDDLNLYLSATDILITPYHHKEQISSGPLTFAMGAHIAIVSTPFWYAQEMLKEDRGRLFGFKNSNELAEILNDLIANDDKLQALKTNSYAFGKDILWSKISLKYLALAKSVVNKHASPESLSNKKVRHEIPDISLNHIRRLTDNTGIISEARHAIADYRSGYTIEDNARALLAYTMLNVYHNNFEMKEYISKTLSFIQFLQQEDGTFRERLNFDRSYSDKTATEVAFGHTVWSLGYLIMHAPGFLYLEAAKELFYKASEYFEKLTSLTGIAGSITGIFHYLEHHKTDQQLAEKMNKLAGMLIEKYKENSTPDWPWPEYKLHSESAIIPLALLHTSEQFDDKETRVIALEMVKFLEKLTLAENHLSLIGKGVYEKGGRRSYFEQQPVDATAMVLMFKKAWEITGNNHYYKRMRVCFNWFIGQNDLSLSVYDPESRGCCDGLEEYGINRNQGAQSILAFLVAQIATLKVVKQVKLSQAKNKHLAGRFIEKPN